MRLSRPRGPDWKYTPSNRGDCPRNAIPLWQALNPLVWGQTSKVRDETERNILEAQELRPYIRVTPRSMRCVSFGDQEPTEAEIRWFRRKAYQHLPEYVRDTMPDGIRRKYGPRTSKASVA